MIWRAFTALGAIVAGVMAVYAYQGWTLDGEHRSITVIGVEASTTSTGDRVLTVQMETDPQPSCIRTGIHLMFQDRPDGLRHYVPLAPALNGLGFAATMVLRFEVSMNLPANMAQGEWFYLSRTMYMCPVPLFSGLLRIYTDQSVPQAVHVPGAGS